MKKIIRLTESQMAKLTEVRINEVTAAEVAKVLETIPCTGQSVKSLISKKLLEYSPSTNFSEGMDNFLDWFTTYKDIK